MSIGLYMDVHVRRAVTEGLRHRGVDVLTSQEDGTTRLQAPDLLDRATLLGRVLFTQDEDLLREASGRQRGGLDFLGVIYAHQARVSTARRINDLEVLAKLSDIDEWLNRVVYLPL